MACEDTIFPELTPVEPVTVVDAFINDKSEAQVIRVTRTQPFFNVSEPPSISGAEVMITDDEGNVFLFEESETPGEYVWNPTSDNSQFGKIGNTYRLEVVTEKATYTATAPMNRVPEIDSITFRYEEGDNFFPEGYYAEFFARDPVGPGDTYWIRAYKNEEFLNKPSEINTAFDAGFTEGGNVDGLVFIFPIRDAINPLDEKEDDDEFLPPYLPGDSVYVEILSISEETFDFLNEVRIQTDRPGGFAELFAVPLANVPTNIVSSNPDEKVQGFFTVSAVSGKGKRLDPDNLPPKVE